MKSKEKTHLFTQGNEYFIQNSQNDYVGWFNIDAEEKIYTEKTFDNEKSTLLLPISKRKDIYEMGIKSDDVIKLKTQIDVKSYFPVIKQSDRDNGYINRYFVRKVNVDFLYLREVDFDTYTSIQNRSGVYYESLYNIYAITWYIAGSEIECVNKNMEEIKKYPILNNLLKDLNQFYKK